MRRLIIFCAGAVNFGLLVPLLIELFTEGNLVLEARAEAEPASAAIVVVFLAMFLLNIASAWIAYNQEQSQ